MYIDGRLVWQCFWGFMLAGEILGSIKDAWRRPYVDNDDLTDSEKGKKFLKVLIERLIIMLFAYNFVMSLRND